MAMTVGISALIGVALGQRFNVLILIPTIILAMVSTAFIEVMRGAEVWSMALTIVLVATVLQIVYLVGSIVLGVVENLAPLTTSRTKPVLLWTSGVITRRGKIVRRGEYSSMRGTFLPTTSNLFASSLMAAMQTDGIRAIHGRVRQLMGWMAP